MTGPSPAVTAFKAPLYIAWEITHRCNARCVHCYSTSSPEADCGQDLTTAEALSVIDQLADAGLMVLGFSGGEPMLRRDWRELVGHAVRRGLCVNVGTNGSTVTERTAADLEHLGVRSVTVSLDSHLPEVHECFRGLVGLHKKAVRAIQLLATRGVRVVVGFTPTRLNATHGPDVIALAHRLGAAAVNLSEYVPAGRGRTDLALEPDKLHDVLRQWIELRERYRGVMQIIWHDCRVGMLVSEEERRRYVGCGAGRLVARICPDGTVTPCVFLSIPIGTFRRKRFSEMWKGSALLRRFRERSANYSGNCGDCEHLESCGGCRAVAFAYSGGDPFAGDPHCWVKSCDTTVIGDLASGEALPV